jgi:uncharacterized cupin superfamily protein
VTAPIDWDDVPGRRPDLPGLGGSWRQLSAAAGSVGIGLNRIHLDPGEVSTPAHVHTSDEEIFFVLAGSGLSWQDGETHEIGAGDCLVHPARSAAHTMRAGDDGLDLLGYGTRTPVGGAYLPNVGAYWLAVPNVWLDVSPGDNPFTREPGIEWPAPEARPETTVHLDDLEAMFGGRAKGLSRGAGAKKSGLNWLTLKEGESGAPPHCHSAEEEIFVVLDGEGVLELWSAPNPEQPMQTEPSETHPVRRGSVVARPPATRVSHSFRAGAPGLTLLAYGTKDPSDVCWYPRSNKIFFRGVGVIGRLELLEYSDGEPD